METNSKTKGTDSTQGEFGNYELLVVSPFISVHNKRLRIYFFLSSYKLRTFDVNYSNNCQDQNILTNI